MAPSVFVIILNFNGARWLINCLDALLKTTYPNFSIVVVDNASTDNSIDIIVNNYPQVVLIRNQQNQGFSAGNNTGIRYALKQQADYVVLLNPDTMVKPDWLSHLVTVGEQEPLLGILGALQFRYENDEWNEWTMTMLSSESQALQGNMSSPLRWVEIEWVEGSCFAIKRLVLQTIGLFDPIFFSFYEEIDYCRRARYHGFFTALVYQSSYHHYRGGIWNANANSRYSERDYQCDRSQFIYSLTAPSRMALENLLAYAETVFVKCKEALLKMEYQRLLALLYMQLTILRDGIVIWRKWRNDRLKIIDYGAD